jgi:predicted enzyme related to lactoylglutathione lyase
MIKQIKFVSIPVADQDRALDFYTEKLGFTIITDQPFDEKQRWIELRVPKAETRVVLFTTDEDKGRVGSFMNMSYTCDDLQKTYEDLKKRGSSLKTRRKRNIGATSPSSKTAKEIALSSVISRPRQRLGQRGWTATAGCHLALVLPR